ncbi:MAG TPA: SET domain-containing protein-lysine N-methyltransferase [Streptomyces sp.]|uniref:SET domain-containing protein-lysine N-methyltransferase n=1 Tax=Streptomyces sp. TaxID=1931 RepID=UPI002D15002E|nr:SET domain-containing protein-lysine N-methyltransferase [Streptomyces sp.]HWU08610.1 SET domain-containing protein-lysine N-methyltransferase [Streptomyces sp.]
MTDHPHLPFRTVRGPETGLNRTLATQPLPTGSLIGPITTRHLSPRPTPWTIQVSETRHIRPHGGPEYMNHSCRPNCRIDTSSMTLHALLPVAAGTEVTFFYPSTEWHLARPFTCWCQEPGCLGRITGADTCPAQTLTAHRLTPHIDRLLSQKRHLNC